MADHEATAEADESVTTHRLYAEFEITPSAELSCPLEELDGEIGAIDQQLTGEDCHTDTTVTRQREPSTDQSPDTELVHTKTELDAMCHCPVFVEYDCLPQVTAVDDGKLIVETYLPDRSRLTELIDALGEVTGGVSLRRLTRLSAADSDPTDQVTLELADLTSKQREAATTAVANGYYGTPRETSVGELATELGISKSAMSQRLNTVESKLAVAAFR